VPRNVGLARSAPGLVPLPAWRASSDARLILRHGKTSLALPVEFAANKLHTDTVEYYHSCIESDFLVAQILAMCT
jgi:hypothetical protein